MADHFEITRVFAAPRGRVWEAWSDPAVFAAWMSPKGTKTQILHADVRPGGRLHSRVEAPDGSVSWARNVYIEIDPPSRIVWRQGWANKAGDIVAAPFPMPWPREMLTEAALTEVAGGTRVDLTWTPVDPTADERASFTGMIASMTGGWTATFDQLDAVLAPGPSAEA